MMNLKIKMEHQYIEYEHKHNLYVVANVNEKQQMFKFFSKLQLLFYELRDFENSNKYRDIRLYLKKHNMNTIYKYESILTCCLFNSIVNLSRLYYFINDSLV